jgi:dTDP-L-rhamnose 4-epimerase
MAYVDHNDLATASLLRALHERRFAGRMVLASSMVVYGEGGYRCADHGPVHPGPRSPVRLDAGDFEPRCPACDASLVPEAVTEDAPTDPRNVYAATKLHQEHLVAAYAREHEASWIALRYHNVYGPGMPRNTPYAGVASIFRSAAARGERPRVFEDGGQRRDFVHVHDVARANVLALVDVEVGARADGAYNIATGTPRTVLDMADALVAGTPSTGGSGAIAPEIVGGYRVGDVRHVFASPRRASEQLGFEARIGFDEGMRAFATAELRGVDA